MHVIRNDADIAEGLRALTEADERLATIAPLAGPLPLRLAEPGFEGLASIIVSQMVSKASAAAIWSRLVQLTRVGLSVEALLALDETRLRTAGLSGAKITALRGAAEAVAEGRLDLLDLCRFDAKEATRQLTAVKGIGEWTADVYLMFCAGHADIFPVGDVALQAAVAHALGLAARPAKAELAGLAAPWAPWRSVAARLFWAYYSREMKRNTDPLG